MSYANRKQMSSNRTAAIIIVALIHIALGYALVTGLAYNVIKKAAEDLKTFDVEDEPPPPPEEPPPPPDTNVPPPPQVVAPPPIVRTNTVAPPIVSVNIARRYRSPRLPGRRRRLRQRRRLRGFAGRQAKANLTSLFSTETIRSRQSAMKSRHDAVRSASNRWSRSRCSISASSGSTALDNATCNILSAALVSRRRRPGGHPSRTLFPPPRELPGMSFART